MKFVRTLCLLIVLVVIVGAIAVASLYMFIDPNKLKSVITAQVKQQTGYDLKIEGNLSWSVYPAVGVNVRHMTITSPDQTEPFVDLHDVIIASELSQLIKGRGTIQGDVFISDVKLMNVHATNARVTMHWKDGLLSLQPITASLYDGKLQGSAHGRDLSVKAKWDWSVLLEQVQLKPLLLDVNGADSKVKISGLGQVKLQASTTGMNREQLMSNLDGSGEFRLSNGVVDGVDLNFFLRSADAIINKQPIPAPTGLNQTAFTSLTGTTVIKNGVANTEDLLLVSEAFTTKGEGDINLVNQALSYHLQVTPAANAKTQWAIPVLVTGDLRRPDVRLDVIKLQTTIAGIQFEKAKARVSKEIEKLPMQADKLLKNLLGR